MSGTNRLCSDEDRSYVDTIQECKEVAQAMEYPYRGDRERFQYPKGCYFHHDAKYIYYNYHSIGEKDKHAEQICKGKGKLLF